MACNRLEVVTWQRIALFRRSIGVKQEDLEGHAAITGDSVPLATETTALTEQMRSEETRLLAVRVGISHRRFVLAIVVLAIAFVLALIMFLIYYRLLSEELDARQQAESTARQGEDALRFLTGRLLRLQDEERRKISRELHDSLGQSLVGVKMHLEILARKHPAEDDLKRCIFLIDQSIGEMRTISHLMHPPLLDEVGFAPAAKWYVAGFSQRSGIEVSLQMPETVARLPHTVELSLFRILQEGLTNIHRHSHSTRAEIVLKIKESQVVLKIKDYGTGISQEALNRFRSTGASVGVGMAGMRERVREIAGQIEIQSNGTGTLISVTMPLSEG
jgi:signal transduction histidine kinase